MSKNDEKIFYHWSLNSSQFNDPFDNLLSSFGPEMSYLPDDNNKVAQSCFINFIQNVNFIIRFSSLSDFEKVIHALVFSSRNLRVHITAVRLT